MKHAIHFLAGLLLGSAVIVCTGAASAVSQTVTATLTTSPIFLDGKISLLIKRISYNLTLKIMATFNNLFIIQI